MTVRLEPGDMREVLVRLRDEGVRKRTEVLWLNPACVARQSGSPLIDRMRA